MNYLQENIVSFTMESYLKKIVGNNFEKEFMCVKDFKSLLTIKLYSEEFKIEKVELDKINDFFDKYLSRGLVQLRQPS